MSESESAERPLRKTLYKMLKNSLIEIRASEDIEKAKQIADIFHNLPMMLEKSRTANDDQRAYETIISSAKRYKLEHYICRLKTLSQ